MTRHRLRVSVLVLEVLNDLGAVLVPQPLERVNDPVAVVHAFVLGVFGDYRLGGVHIETVADNPSRAGHPPRQQEGGRRGGPPLRAGRPGPEEPFGRRTTPGKRGTATGRPGA